MQPPGGATPAGLLAAGTTLAWPRAGRIVAQIASGVVAAHAVNLPHSGISPHCVLVSGGQAKLADVGLAVLTAASRDAKLNTADVMAADVFALGTLLDTTVTGHPPRAGLFGDDDQARPGLATVGFRPTSSTCSASARPSGVDAYVPAPSSP